MYIEIGAFDAKAKLSALLREVQRGQCYTITVRGTPVADLVPSTNAVPADIDEAIKAMRTIKKVRGISKKTLQAWINEGRK